MEDAARNCLKEVDGQRGQTACPDHAGGCNGDIGCPVSHCLLAWGLRGAQTFVVSWCAGKPLPKRMRSQRNFAAIWPRLALLQRLWRPSAHDLHSGNWKAERSLCYCSKPAKPSRKKGGCCSSREVLGIAHLYLVAQGNAKHVLPKNIEVYLPGSWLASTSNLGYK